MSEEGHMITFEGYERRIDKLNAEMKQYGIENLESMIGGAHNG